MINLPSNTQKYLASWLLLILLISIPSFAIDFALEDTNFTNCIRGLAKKNGWQNFQQVRQIQCSSKKIKSAEGLHQFPNLEVLNLHKNKLKAIDLSTFKSLRTINLARNNLTNLHIEHLKLLESLYLFGNKLERLHLNNLPALKVVKVHSNRLQAFDYGNLPRLQTITLFDNTLKTVDIYSLPKLKVMDCRENPMPDALYEEMDKMTHIKFLHDGNADDW